jgi:hypothetical protein
MRRLLVLLGTVSALALAAPTSAEPGVDGSFIDALSKAGITFNDPSSAVEAGHTTCDLISQGKWFSLCSSRIRESVRQMRPNSPRSR